MELQPYLQWAKTKEKVLPTARDRASHAYIGLLGELGEFADWIKREVILEQEFNVLEAKKELGDVCFYAAILMNLKDCETEGVLGYPIEYSLTIPIWASFLQDGLHLLNEMGKSLTIRRNQDFLESMQLFGLDFFAWVKAVCETYSWNLSEILDLNVEKLNKRHPSGFTVEGAKMKIDTTGE